MASAAAVAANEPRPDLENNIGEDEGKASEVTSGIYSKDEGLPGLDGELDDDEEEELPSNPLRGHKLKRPANGDAAGPGGLDLFGDEDDGAAEQDKPE